MGEGDDAMFTRGMHPSVSVGLRRLRPRDRTRQRGMTIVYIMFALIALFAVVSLAVDLGRVRDAKAELSTAADAAALAGVEPLPREKFPKAADDAEDAAVFTAQRNTATNTPVVLLPASGDVQLGEYTLGKNGAAGTFTLIGGVLPNGHTVVQTDCNAVHVVTQRTLARKTQVALFF